MTRTHTSNNAETWARRQLPKQKMSCEPCEPCDPSKAKSNTNTVDDNTNNIILKSLFDEFHIPAQRLKHICMIQSDVKVPKTTNLTRKHKLKLKLKLKLQLEHKSKTNNLPMNKPADTDTDSDDRFSVSNSSTGNNLENRDSLSDRHMKLNDHDSDSDVEMHVSVGSETKLAKIIISKRLWRGAEDRKLYKLVTKKGPSHWDKIATHIAHRSGKQCRERWINHVSPDVNKTDWTEAEDKFLIHKVQVLGTKWAAIAIMMSGRKDGAIKNRYMSFVRNQLAPKPASWRAAVAANQHVTRARPCPPKPHARPPALIATSSNSNLFTATPVMLSAADLINHSFQVEDPHMMIMLCQASEATPPATTQTTPTRSMDSLNPSAMRPAAPLLGIPISCLIHDSLSPLPASLSAHLRLQCRTPTPTSHCQRELFVTPVRQLPRTCLVLMSDTHDSGEPVPVPVPVRLPVRLPVSITCSSSPQESGRSQLTGRHGGLSAPPITKQK